MADQVVLKIGADKDAATKAAKEVMADFRTSFTNINAALEILQKGFDAASAVLSRLNDEMRKSVDLALRQEKAQIAHAAALKQLVGATDRQIVRQRAFADELQRTRGIDADLTLELQTTLASLGVTASQMEIATKAAIGMREAMGGTLSLSEAAKKVAKTLKEGTGALKEINIHTDSVSAAFGILIRQFESQNRAAKSTSTQLDILGNDIDDIRKAFGRAITDSGEVKGLLGDISKEARKLSDELNKSQGLRDAVSGIASALRVIIQHGDAVIAFFGKFGVLAAQALGPIGAQVAGIKSAFEFFALQGGAAPSGGEIERGPQTLRELLEKKKGARRLTSITQPPARKKKSKQKFIDDDAAVLAFEQFQHEEELRKARIDGLRHEADVVAEANRKLQELKQSQAQWDADLEEHKLQTAREYKEKRGMLQDEELLQTESFLKLTQRNMAQMANAVGSGIGQAAAAAIVGGEDLGAALKKAAANMISTLGIQLIQMGVAAAAMGALSFIPGLQLVTGPPGLAVGAGAAAIAAGTGMLFVARALGGGGASTPSHGASRGGGGAAGRSRAFDVANRSTRTNGFEGLPGGNRSTVINVHFNAPMADTKRGTARAIRELLRQGDTLALAGA